jgi:hypothetical protein
MNGEILALIATVAGFDTRTPVTTSTPGFEFVEWVRFELWISGATAPAETADSFDGWFAGMQGRGIGRLLLAIPGLNTGGTLPDRRKFGFINTAGWFLIGAGRHRERWRVLWRVGNQQAPDRRIWQILFQGVVADDHDPPTVSAPRPIEVETNNLLGALNAAQHFAQRTQLEPWPASFARALMIGTAPPEPPPAEAAYQGSILPAGWRSPEVRRLLRTALAAGVFGGMGTWNDVAMRDGADAAEHEHVSQQLFIAMLAAYATGVNTA